MKQQQRQDLPQVFFRTTFEAASQLAEDLASIGYAVELKNDGSVYRIGAIEDFSKEAAPCVTYYC